MESSLNAYVAGLKAHDVAAIGASLAEEIRFVTPVKTMKKTSILEFLAALYAGLHDRQNDHDEPDRLGEGSYSIKWRQHRSHKERVDFSLIIFNVG